MEASEVWDAIGMMNAIDLVQRRKNGASTGMSAQCVKACFSSKRGGDHIWHVILSRLRETRRLTPGLSGPAAAWTLVIRRET